MEAILRIEEICLSNIFDKGYAPKKTFYNNIVKIPNSKFLSIPILFLEAEKFLEIGFEAPLPALIPARPEVPTTPN